MCRAAAVVVRSFGGIAQVGGRTEGKQGAFDGARALRRALRTGRVGTRWARRGRIPQQRAAMGPREGGAGSDGADSQRRWCGPIARAQAGGLKRAGAGRLAREGLWGTDVRGRPPGRPAAKASRLGACVNLRGVKGVIERRVAARMVKGVFERRVAARIVKVCLSVEWRR
jgi:hypothetical protein